MKYFLSVSILLFFSFALIAQSKKNNSSSSTPETIAVPEKKENITGQWKGSFTDKSTSFIGWGGDQCEYVLELEFSGQNIKGFSYTYFTDGGIRYYTICRLEGTFNKAQKYIEVKEVERTKTNVPNTIRNCFQIHKLTYFKQGDTETLEGNWIPVPKQEGDCGYGITSLTRRTLKNSYPNFNNGAVAKAQQQKNISPAKTPQAKPKTKPTLPTAKSITKKKEETTDQKKLITKKAPDEIQPPVNTEPDKTEVPAINFEKRNNTVLKTIEVENETVKVELYDNGEIDGDSVSLFYNSKLLLWHKKLSTRPITLNISVDNNKTNELVMYAENLGTIPPNTALMVVTDGANRYEVRITSDLKKSGTIRFVHKP